LISREIAFPARNSMREVPNPILLSIAIPTKNRQHFLMNLVEELCLSTRNDFEIVIHDNSDDDQLRGYVAGLGDSRVRYNFVGHWISVVDNCDAAVEACAGDYICLLGDDDGLLLEESLEVLTRARADRIDAVMSNVMLYTWPDVTHKFIANIGGKLSLRPLVARRNRCRVDETGSLRRVIARSGALGLEGLPCIYQGFISKRPLAEVRARTGSYFPGPSPDMANAIGVGPFLDSCRHVARPLVISGHSRVSGAGRGTMKEHRGAIATQAHLPSDTSESWYPQIPFFWSGPTIYAQSLRRALDRTGVAHLGTPGDACLYAACFLYEGAYGAEIWAAMRSSGRSFMALAPVMALYALLITAQRGVQFMRNLRARFMPRGASLSADSIADAIRLLRVRGA
jgi:hypothetical protein